MREITYALASENGRYNPTIPFGHLQPCFEIISRYKAVVFRRISNYGAARVKILQSSRDLGPNVFASTRKSDFRISFSPTANFGNNVYLFCKVLNHEFGHCAGSTSHLGGSIALMTPNAGSCRNWTEADYGYIGAYAWRGSLRPHQEPNRMYELFSGVRGYYEKYEGDKIEYMDYPTTPVGTPETIKFACEHLPWYSLARYRNP